MDRFSVREVVEMALQTEVLGYKFYTTMMERFKEHDGLKQLFAKLAQQEQAHEKTFAALLANITSTPLPEPEGWQEAQSYFRAMVESEFFLGKGKELPSLEHVKSVKEAISFAIGFEKETALFFVGLKNAVADKGPVDEIIREEARHIQWLHNLKSTLS